MHVDHEEVEYVAAKEQDYEEDIEVREGDLYAKGVSGAAHD
jgi:hypothetical protein